MDDACRAAVNGLNSNRSPQDRMPGPAGDDNNVAELVVQLVSCDTSLTEVFSLLSEYGYAVQDDGAHDDARGREPCAQRQGRPRRGRSPRRVPSPPTPPTTRRGEHPWDVEFFRDADKRVSSTVTRAPKWSFAHSARISCFSQATDEVDQTATPGTDGARKRRPRPSATPQDGRCYEPRYDLVEPRARAVTMRPLTSVRTPGRTERVAHETNNGVVAVKSPKAEFGYPAVDITRTRHPAAAFPRAKRAAAGVGTPTDDRTEGRVASTTEPGASATGREVRPLNPGDGVKKQGGRSKTARMGNRVRLRAELRRRRRVAMGDALAETSPGQQMGQEHPWSIVKPSAPSVVFAPPMGIDKPAPPQADNNRSGSGRAVRGNSTRPGSASAERSRRSESRNAGLHSQPRPHSASPAPSRPAPTPTLPHTHTAARALARAASAPRPTDSTQDGPEQSAAKGPGPGSAAAALRGPRLGPQGGPLEARERDLRRQAWRELAREQSPDRERGPGRYAGATAAYEMASAGPRSLSTVRTPRAATPGRTPRFPSPREERGEGKGQEAELRPELARDAVAPRAPQFSFGKAAGREASRGAGEGTGSDAETHEGVEVGDGASEARTAQYGLVERRGDAGVVAWRGADAHGERARARRARLEAIAAARGVAAEALHYADVAVMGRPGRDDGVRPRAPAWSFGLPPNAVPPVRVPDTNSGDDGEGAGVPALVPVPNLDVVRPRLGGVVDFGLATGRVPRARRRVGARDRADRHELGLLMFSLDGAFGYLRRRTAGPRMRPGQDRFESGLYRALKGKSREGIPLRSEHPEEAIDRLRPRPTRALITPAPSHAPRPSVWRDRPLGISLDWDAARDGVSLRQGRGVVAFARGAGHGPGVEDPSALRRAREWPGPATYAVDHRPTEPTPHAHTMPRASRNLDTSSERVIKDGDYLEIDAATARDAVGPRHAAHYNMSQALVRPEPGNVTGSPAVWVPPSADVGDAVRWRGPRPPDLSRMPGRPSSPPIDIHEARRGPGAYDTATATTDTAPAADFASAPPRPSLFAASTEGDVLALEVAAAVDGVRPRATAAVIAGEHGTVRDVREKEAWDLDYAPRFTAVDPSPTPPPDMAAMLGRAPLFPSAITRPSELAQDASLLALAERIKGGAVDFSAMLGRPDAAAEAAKRGGDVLDIDVAAADRAVRKRAPEAPRMSLGADRSLLLGDATTAAVRDADAEWRPIGYANASDGLRVTRIDAGGSLLEFDRLGPGHETSDWREDWRGYAAPETGAAVGRRGPEVDFGAAAGRERPRVGAPAVRDSWEGQRLALRVHRDAWGGDGAGRGKKAWEQPMALAPGRDALTATDADTDGDRLLLNIPAEMHGLLSQHKAAPRAVFARSAAHAVTVWEETQRARPMLVDENVRDGAGAGGAGGGVGEGAVVNAVHAVGAGAVRGLQVGPASAGAAALAGMPEAARAPLVSRRVRAVVEAARRQAERRRHAVLAPAPAPVPVSELSEWEGGESVRQPGGVFARRFMVD